MASTAATSVALAPMPGRANPLGGQVTAGSATIQGQGTASVIINQSSNRAIINWGSFNIAPNEITKFVQPNSSSVTLNRVTGGMGASQIYGTIDANGGVFIVNPDGVLFGPGAKVNVGSFLVTTHDIANSDFMAGNYNFSISGNPSASIVNQGTITAAKGGFAALVAPGVRNDGVITARLGTVALASANAFSLDLYGDDLIKLQPTDAIAAQVLDVATGQPLTSLVQNTGKLKANGGTVSLTAVSAKQVLDSVINSSGVVEANSVGTKSGMVVFGAATADSKVAGAPTQTVKVGGKINAAGKKPGTTGGKIQVTGENIVLANANLNASGQAGGGKILVGGDFGGGAANAPAVTLLGQSFESTPVPNATNVTVDAASVLNASAITSGNGGKIVVWSNDTTTFAGSVIATGGRSGGNGGFIETSGNSLSIAGALVSAASPKGQAGHWLLDPDDFTVDSSNAGDINGALANGDVILATSATGTGGNGDIFINAPISWSSNTFLTLDAYRSIQVNSNVSLTGDHAGLNITYNDGGTGGSFTTAAGASVTLTGSTPLLAINGNVYTLIKTASDLQAIQSQNSPGYFALANDIDLGGISNFAPIGGTNGSQYFLGIFEGLGHTVSNLEINASSTQGVGTSLSYGLFGSLAGQSVIENLNLSGGSVTVSGAADIYAGSVAGFSAGLITNVSSNVAISTLGSPSGLAGGLVGLNAEGVIQNSHADGNISGATAGGLTAVNTGIINSSYATGAVYGSTFAGGLAGANRGLFTNDVITNSFATGTVTGGDDAYIGGLVGQNENIAIRDSYSTGNVIAGSNATAGGLVGQNLAYVVDSFSAGIISVGANPSYVGSLIGYDAGEGGNYFAIDSLGTGGVTIGGISQVNPQQSSSFRQNVYVAANSIGSITANWDFVNTWYQPSAGYPLLQAFRTAAITQPLSTGGSGSGGSGAPSAPPSSPATGGSASTGSSGSNILNQQITVFDSAQKDGVSEGTIGSVLASPYKPAAQPPLADAEITTFLAVADRLGELYEEAAKEAMRSGQIGDLQFKGVEINGVIDFANVFKRTYLNYQQYNGSFYADYTSAIDLLWFVDNQLLSAELGRIGRFGSTAAGILVTGHKSLVIMAEGLGEMLLNAMRYGN